MIFMNSVKDYYTKSQINEVTISAFDLKYRLEINPSACQPSHNFQNVEMIMICEGKTGMSYNEL